MYSNATQQRKNAATINRGHIFAAAAYLTEEGLPKGFGQSKSLTVIIKGRSYPPKAVAGVVFKFANNRAKAVNNFHGARDGVWNKRLRELGFEIHEIATPKVETPTSEVVPEGELIPREIQPTLVKTYARSEALGVKSFARAM